jgi:hypothetical protein
MSRGRIFFYRLNEKKPTLEKQVKVEEMDALCDQETGGYDYSNDCIRYMLHLKSSLGRNLR